MAFGYIVTGLNPTLQNTFIFTSLNHGQVNRPVRHRIDVAGKGANTTRVLTQLGEDAVHLTYVGGRNRNLFNELSHADSVTTDAVESRCEIRFCHTVIDLARREATEIVEPGGPVDAGVETALLDRLRVLMAGAHTLIVSGSRADGFSDSIYSEMVGLASHAGLRTVLDIRGEDLKRCLEHRPTLLKINVTEFARTFLPDTSLNESTAPSSIPPRVFETMLDVRSEYGMDIVLTHGRYPVLYTDGEKVSQLLPDAIKPINPIGSGDAFTAGMTSAIHRGEPLAESVRHGMSCAVRNALLEKPGAIE